LAMSGCKKSSRRNPPVAARQACSAMIRLRITFAKTPAMRFTGHLDLHRAWERTFRRAALPLAYSEGFNPHPRLNLASALPLGFTGQCEVIDAWLEQDLPLPEIQSALQRALPPGLQVLQLETVDLRLPALQTELEASEYHITLLEQVPHLADRIGTLLSAPDLPRQRRGRDYDLRPLILDLDILPPPASPSPDSPDHQQLSLRLVAREGATGRPEEVLDALGYDPQLARVHRVKLLFRTQ
jgi:radical SAM-linked protein